jgi:hypothetical protein
MALLPRTPAEQETYEQIVEMLAQPEVDLRAIIRGPLLASEHNTPADRTLTAFHLRLRLGANHIMDREMSLHPAHVGRMLAGRPQEPALREVFGLILLQCVTEISLGGFAAAISALGIEAGGSPLLVGDPRPERFAARLLYRMCAAVDGETNPLFPLPVQKGILHAAFAAAGDSPGLDLGELLTAVKESPLVRMTLDAAAEGAAYLTFLEDARVAREMLSDIEAMQKEQQAAAPAAE